MSYRKLPDELTEGFKSRNQFILIGHKEPDGDCLSSQLALGSYLKRNGKKTALVSPGPFTRPEIEHQKKLFLEHVPVEFKNPETMTVILDCSTLERIDYLADEIEGTLIAVIDHHNSGELFGDVRWIWPEAPSVTFMIEKLVSALGGTPTKEEAELLLFGIATDTGYFRHLDQSSAELFSAVSRLTAAGASPKAAFAEMYGGRTLGSRQLLGRLLARAESAVSGKLIISTETEEDLKEFGTENRDSDSLYQQLQSIKNAETAVLFRYEGPGKISVGLRSRLYADVGAVAKSFGGGGHRKAAGFTWNGSLEEIKKLLIPVFEKIL